MGCNNMQPGISKFNQSLLMPPDMNNCSADSVFSQRRMGFNDTDNDILLAESGYNVKAADLAHVAQRLEQLDSLCASQDASVLSQLSSDAVHYNPSDLAGWIECMIGELAAPSPLAEPDIGSSVGACNSIFGPQTPVQCSLEDDYGGFHVGSCSTDRNSSSHMQFDTQPAYTGIKPKQSVPTSASAGVQESAPSISQLIKDAIGKQGVSPAANGPRYDARNYSGMVVLNEGMGELKQYKIVEDQASSNQMGSFYQSSVGDQSHEGPFSSGFSSAQAVIPRSSSMPTLQPQQIHVVPLQVQQVHQQVRSPSQHSQLHVRQPQKFKPSTGPLPSSQSSNVRALYANAPPHRHLQHHLQAELSPQEVKVRAASISPSSSSPMAPYQHTNGSLDKDSTYLHMQSMRADKLPHDPPRHQQQGGMYVESDDGAQELGIRLVHLLMACAEAIPKNELAAALDMVREIKRLASSSTGAMGKVANYFVEALAGRIYGASIEGWASHSPQADTLTELLYSHFYEACPYLKFAHFTANQAILEAFKDHKSVHVIDFNLMQGSQWPALIQALALRPGGPPHLRMTGIGPPQPDNKDVLQEVGMKLAQIAGSVNVEFSFRGVVATKLDDVKPWMFEVKRGEAIAVNSILQLHKLLYGHSTSNPSIAPIDEVLTSIKSLSPNVVTIVEQEANHNSPVFLERFVEALHYYCTMFDSLEACSFPPNGHEMACTEMYLAREIMNIVACDGPARAERHEPLSQWRKRMLNAGFQPLHLGSNAFKQASLLLKWSSGEGYTVEESRGCLTLGWHSRPLIAASAWQCG